MPPVRLSDHSAFWDEGYKAVMVTDSAFYRNPHYHLPSDTMDKLDFRRMAELVKACSSSLVPEGLSNSNCCLSLAVFML